MGLVSDILGGIEKRLVGSDNVFGPNGLFFGGGADSETTGQVQPGDINIMDITLTSADEQRGFSLMSHCKLIDIFESITSPCIFAELHIADAIGLHEKFPLIGEEYVNIIFRTPGTKKPAVYTFHTRGGPFNKKVHQNGKMLTYTISCVSNELIRNGNKLVSIPGLNDTPANGVRKILKEELITEKRLATLEETIGIDDSKIVRLEPFKAIDYLRRRSVSRQHKSSSFVFFENRDGYNFVTLEKLLAEGAKSAEIHDKVFFFDSGTNNQDVRNVSMRNIIAYNQVSQSETMSKIAEGGLKTKVTTIDKRTGTKSVTEITNKDSQDKFKYSSADAAGQNTSGFDRRHGNNTSVNLFVPTSGKLESFLAEKLAYLRIFTSKVTQNIVQIHVYGDSDITVGDVITCKLPLAVGTTGETEETKLSSGNYLVSKLRHMIVISDRPQHTISMELIRASL